MKCMYVRICMSAGDIGNKALPSEIRCCNEKR